MVKKLAAIVFIYLCTSAAWLILSATVSVRTNTQDTKLRNAVGQLWGVVQVQKAPSVYYETLRKVETTRVESGKTISETQIEMITNHLAVKTSRVNVSLTLEHRRKGLLWYSTYRVQFAGAYTVMNDTSDPRDVHFVFAFPTERAVYDDFRFKVGDKLVENAATSSA